jgi:hypothetical protein
MINKQQNKQNEKNKNKRRKENELMCNRWDQKLEKTQTHLVMLMNNKESKSSKLFIKKRSVITRSTS